MAKRRPDVQLTKDNFDRDQSGDESQEEYTGPMKMASEDVLKRRPIVKAKRRLAEGEATNGSTANIFSGLKSTFGSFSGSNTLGQFSFGGSGSFNSTSTTSTLAASTTSSTDAPAPVFKITGFQLSDKPATANTIPVSLSNESASKETTLATSTSTSTNPTGPNTITKLNQAFYEHVKKFMESEPTKAFDFTVVCQEYINQLKVIKESAKSETVTTSSAKKNDASATKTATTGLFKFGDTKFSTDSTTFKLPISSSSNGFMFSTQTSSLPSFGSTATSSSKPAPFSFGLAASSASSGSSSLFSTSTPLTTKFSMPTPPPTIKEDNESAATDAGDGGGEEEDTPPKVVSVEHSEQDAVYSKKCKLYYQKDGTFIDKGLGFLYIKVRTDSKPQLLIRSDTTTGNILLNIALVESLPVIKADSNKGVMLTCIPNPEVEPKKKEDDEKAVNGEEKKTVTYFIRVKPSDAEDLYDSIVKYKSSSQS